MGWGKNEHPGIGIPRETGREKIQRGRERTKLAQFSTSLLVDLSRKGLYTKCFL